MVDTPEVVRVIKEILQYIGQGDGETKWKGWAWNKDLLIKDNSYINYFTSIYEIY